MLDPGLYWSWSQYLLLWCHNQCLCSVHGTPCFGFPDIINGNLLTKNCQFCHFYLFIGRAIHWWLRAHWMQLLEIHVLLNWGTAFPVLLDKNCVKPTCLKRTGITDRHFLSSNDACHTIISIFVWYIFFFYLWTMYVQ